MKKLFSMLLVFVMAVGLLTACTGNSKDAGNNETNNSEATPTASSDAAPTEAAPTEASTPDPTQTKYKIAVAIPDYGVPQQTMFKNIYENIISKEFNIEFIFSEALNNDIAAEMQFMENAKNGGAQAYISFNVTTSEHGESIAAKANDLGLYCAINGNLTDNVVSLPYVAGGVDASVAIDTIAEQFKELTNILVSDGKPHNVVICTMGAAQGSSQHIQSTAAALNALKDVYGLTFEDDSAKLATAQNVTTLSTGTDMKITLIPGIQVTDAVEQVLKTGEYDVLICVGPQYAWFQSVISAVETNLKMDIKTCSIMGVGEATATSFHTKDATGNSSLNCALLKNSTVADQLFVLVYNALTGNIDTLKVDKKATTYPNLMWVCDSAETYDLLGKIDSSTDLAAYTTDEIKQMVVAINPAVTSDDFMKWCQEATADNILTKRGLK